MENKTERLASFSKAKEAMISTNANAYGAKWQNKFGSYYGKHTRDYDSEEVQSIIKEGSILQQAAMSRAFFARDGFYKRILIHYGTLLKYAGILIPSAAQGKSIKDKSISKRYYQAVDFMDRVDVPLFATNIAMRALIDGTYYGVIQTLTKKEFAVLDLPHSWCRTNYKDVNGNDIVEFNVAYFDTITDKDTRNNALEAYPEEISLYYKTWVKNKGAIKSWMFVSTDIGICFQFFDSRPLFLQVILSALEYDDTITREAEMDLEEIKKIIVQKIPHNGNELLFEPDEAADMHAAAVGMLQASNPNVSVLTTYADVEAVSSKANLDSTKSSSIERAKDNIYYRSGTSSQIFAASGNLAIEASLKNDLALVMVLANKISLFLTNITNRLYGNSNIGFKYTILPVSWYNEDAYLEQTYKMANYGYSLLLPAIAQGFSQKDLTSIKSLENDLLELTTTVLQPPLTASTAGAQADIGGRPALGNEDKTDKTIQNQEIEDSGGVE